MSFFHLQDLVDEGAAVRHFLPFDDFRGPSVPTSVEAYRSYRDLSVEFIRARNSRIAARALD